MYRWYLSDPIRFERSLVWTIEHGHDNNYGNDYTSVAYWYQAEPHRQFPALPPVEARLPRLPQEVRDADAARAECANRIVRMREDGIDRETLKRMYDLLNSGSKLLAQGRAAEASGQFQKAR